MNAGHRDVEDVLLARRLDRRHGVPDGPVEQRAQLLALQRLRGPGEERASHGLGRVGADAEAIQAGIPLRCRRDQHRPRLARQRIEVALCRRRQRSNAGQHRFPQPDVLDRSGTEPYPFLEAPDLLAIGDLHLEGWRPDRRDLLPHEREHAETQEQMPNVLDEATRLRVVLDVERVVAPVDATVTREQRLQEEPYGSLGGREDCLRHELALGTDGKAVAFQPARGPVALGNAAAARVVHQPITVVRSRGDDAESTGGNGAFQQGDEHGILAGERRAVAWCGTLALRDHQTQERCFPIGQRRAAEHRHLARGRDAVARSQRGQRRPPVQLPERVVGRGPDAQSRARPQLEDRLASLWQEVRHGSLHRTPAVEGDRAAKAGEFRDGSPSPRVGVDDARVPGDALPEAHHEHVPRYPEVLDGAGERERVRRDDADVAREVDERSGVEALRIDDRRVDVGEDLEFAAAADVVAVARRAVRDDAPTVDLAHLPRLVGLDHALLGRHAADPAVGLDGHATLRGGAATRARAPRLSFGKEEDSGGGVREHPAIAAVSRRNRIRPFGRWRATGTRQRRRGAPTAQRRDPEPARRIRCSG
jgi:hypothetical protein